MRKGKKLYYSREEKSEILQKAAPYLTLTYEEIWNSVTSQMVPRSYALTNPQTIGCPVCGQAVAPYGNYPYQMDFFHTPWKLTCPSCKTQFPTNDFKAYYEGGLDENGFFCPDLAKAHNDALIARGEPGNLVNLLYPEKGAGWGVDDSTGFVDENGQKYTFVAYYNRFAWDQAVISGCLSAMSEAYRITEEPIYANRTVVLLDRIADVYPDMDQSLWTRENGFLNANGGSCEKGKIFGSISECMTICEILQAMEAIVPVLEDNSASPCLEALAFLRQKHPERDSISAIRKHLEDGIIREVFPAVKSTQIYGNSGMHQQALALAAVLLDQEPETRGWLEFDFQSGIDSREAITGGGIRSTLVNRIDRDGHGDESSPAYHYVWIYRYLNIANILDGYQVNGLPAETYDLFHHVKFRKMVASQIPLILSDLYMPAIADALACGKPEITLQIPVLIQAFLRYEDPIFAQAAYLINGNRMEGMSLSGYSQPPERIRDKIEEVIRTHGILSLGGTHLTGYGFAALRDGEAGDLLKQDRKNSTQRDIWLYYGKTKRAVGHGHNDALNLGMHAYGLDLMPDLGYPRYADPTDKHRTSVVLNTLMHNTVTIDNRQQASQVVGQPLHFHQGNLVKLADVSDLTAYPSLADTYRRTTAMIRIDEGNSYVVDFFRAAGGSTHCFSFHSGECGKVVTEGLSLKQQTDESGRFIGTYAGKDLPYPVRCDLDDPTGFRYLINVEKTQGKAGSFTADYCVRDTWNVYGDGASAETDVHVKLTALGEFDEVALADALPPETKVGNPAKIRYILMRRNGDHLNSCFTQVIEPYRGGSNIAAVQPLCVQTKDGTAAGSMQARALKVTLRDGTIDYIVNAVDPTAEYIAVDGSDSIPFQGFWGLCRIGKTGKRFYFNEMTRMGSFFNPQCAVLTGTVVDFTRELQAENEITVKMEENSFPVAGLAGKEIYIDNDGIYNAAYRIVSAHPAPDGKTVLSIGDVTPIRSYIDEYDFSKGYRYDIEPGAAFRIPLAWEGTSEESVSHR